MISTHGTLSADTVATVTIGDQSIDAIQVVNRGDTDIYFTFDGSAPSSSNPHANVVPANDQRTIGLDHRGAKPVKLISTGTPAFSVIALTAGELVEEGAADNGGATTGGLTVYRYDFAYDTPGLEDGIEVYTPTIGDLFIDALFSVTTAFNGTTPTADLCPLGADAGLWASYASAMPDLSSFDHPYGDGIGNLSLAISSGVAGYPSQFVASTGIAPHPAGTSGPWKLVVSQDGAIGGDPIGGTAGAGSLYLLIATPVVLG